MNKKIQKTRVQRLQESTARESQRFSIRKLSVGAASVLLGTTLFFGTRVQQVSADTTQNQTQEQTDIVQASDKDNTNGQDTNQAETANTQQASAQGEESTTNNTQNTATVGSTNLNGGGN